MKLARARSRRAPWPKWTTKRAPEILAARSKSRMPRASPSSQWGLAGKSNCVGCAPGLFELVGVLVLADGDGVVGQVGKLLEECSHLEIGFDCAGLEGGDAVFEGGRLECYGGRVFAFAFEATDLLRESVALGLEGLDLSDSGAACGVELGEICE